MKHKALMVAKLFFLISFISHLLIFSSDSAPTTRSLIMKSSNKEKPTLKENFINTNQVKLEEIMEGEKFEIGEGFFEGRMDFEKTDYAGVGANPVHDPKPPPKV